MSLKIISQQEGFTQGFPSTWRHGSGQRNAAGHVMIKYECVLACPVVFCIRVLFCRCEQTAANKKQNKIALFFVAMCLVRACGPLLAACAFSQGSPRSFFQRWYSKKILVKIASINMTTTTATSRNRPDKPDRPTDPIRARERQGSCLHFGSSITSWYDFNV